MYVCMCVCIGVHACMHGCECVRQIGYSEKKGRCVVTRAFIPANTYVCEYRGDLIGYKEATRREELYNSTKQGCYMFFFNQGSTRMWCVW